MKILHRSYYRCKLYIFTYHSVSSCILLNEITAVRTKTTCLNNQTSQNFLYQFTLSKQLELVRMFYRDWAIKTDLQWSFKRWHIDPVNGKFPSLPQTNGVDLCCRVIRSNNAIEPHERHLEFYVFRLCSKLMTFVQYKKLAVPAGVFKSCKDMTLAFTMVH